MTDQRLVEMTLAHAEVVKSIKIVVEEMHKILMNIKVSTENNLLTPFKIYKVGEK